MDKIIRMTPEQAAMVKKVVRKRCCNYIDGNCLLLDGLDPCPCPQLITRSLICRWFSLRCCQARKICIGNCFKRASRKPAPNAARPTTPPPIGADTVPSAPQK